MTTNKGGRRNEAAARNGKKVGKPLTGDVARESFSFSLPPTLGRDWLDDLSRITGKSRSVLVEEALEQLRLAS